MANKFLEIRGKLAAALWVCILSPMLESDALALCDLDSNSQETKALCQVINSVELETGCDAYLETQEVHDACVSLTELRSGGSCKSFRQKESPTTFLICSEIYLGMRQGKCGLETETFGLSLQESQGIDTLVARDTRLAMCEFGNYIKNNHPYIIDARQEVILSQALEQGLDSSQNNTPLPSRRTSVRTVPSLDVSNSVLQKSVEDLQIALTHLSKQTSKYPFRPENRTKAKNIGIKIFQAIAQNRLASLNANDIANFIKKLIHAVELNRAQWTEEAKNLGHDIKINLDDPIEGGTAPCAIQISPTGHLLVHLDKISVREGRKISILPIGQGTFKKISLSLNYDLAIAPQATSPTNDSFMAAGRLLLPGTIGSAKEQSSQKELSREMMIQKLFDGKVGIAPAGVISHAIDRKNPAANELVTSQKFFPYDLHKYGLHLNSTDFETVEGHTKIQIKIDLALDLLEGLTTIHEAGFHHRDIKPANVLVGYDHKKLPHAYIADFGTAYNIHEDTDTKDGGTLLYWSPEYVVTTSKMGNKNLNLKNDVWALGLTLYVLDRGSYPLAKKFPLKSQAMQLIWQMSQVKEYVHIKSIMGLDFNSDIPPQARSFDSVVYQMLNPNPLLRPTAQEAWDLMKEVHQFHIKPAQIGSALRFQYAPKQSKKLKWEDITTLTSPIEHSGIHKIETHLNQQLELESNHYRLGPPAPLKNKLTSRKKNKSEQHPSTSASSTSTSTTSSTSAPTSASATSTSSPSVAPPPAGEEKAAPSPVK